MKPEVQDYIKGKAVRAKFSPLWIVETPTGRLTFPLDYFEDKSLEEVEDIFTQLEVIAE